MAFLLTITYVLITQMGHPNPFLTSTFQEIFNDIRNSSIQWVLTLTITLWKFRSLDNGSSLGTMEVHTLAFSYTPRNMKCESRASLLTHTFASPCLGCEPLIEVNPRFFKTNKKQEPWTQMLENDQSPFHIIINCWNFFPIQLSPIDNNVPPI